MANFPSFQEYNEALRDPRSAFIDDELKNGTVKTSLHGTPMPFAGGLALAYKITHGSKKFAARCFHKNIDALHSRYWAIGKRLASLNAPYFVDFEFQDPGINVAGRQWPIVKMGWAEGAGLASFLASNYANPSALQNLDGAITSLAAFLENNRIGHGNIEPGNLLIRDNGLTLQLVDYDGMYLDEIKSLGCREAGLRNFQHPERTIENWGPTMDRFSFLLLHVVINLLVKAPDLWTITQPDRDSLIFKANDFENPSDSPVFRLLFARPDLSGLAQAFAKVCESSIDTVPAIGEFDAGKIAESTRRSSTNSGYLGNYPVLDAHDYASCLEKVGDVVELVGKIESSKPGFTKKGKPYYFLNFGDWRGDAVKVSVWPKALKKSGIDFDSLEGKYISITGLLEPPYVTRTYSHITITLGENTPLKELSPEEAKYRLGSAARYGQRTQSDSSGIPQPLDPHPGRRLYAKLEKKPAVIERKKPPAADSHKKGKINLMVVFWQFAGIAAFFTLIWLLL